MERRQSQQKSLTSEDLSRVQNTDKIPQILRYFLCFFRGSCDVVIPQTPLQYTQDETRRTGTKKMTKPIADSGEYEGKRYLPDKLRQQTDKRGGDRDVVLSRSVNRHSGDGHISDPMHTDNSSSGYLRVSKGQELTAAGIIGVKTSKRAAHRKNFFMMCLQNNQTQFTGASRSDEMDWTGMSHFYDII